MKKQLWMFYVQKPETAVAVYVLSYTLTAAAEAVEKRYKIVTQITPLPLAEFIDAEKHFDQP